MIVKVTVWLPLPFVTTDVFQEFPALCAHEALGMPALLHGTDNAPND